MAIMPSQTKPAAILDNKYTGPAAIVSIVLAMGGIAAIVTAAVVFKNISAGAITYLAGWIVLLVVVISAGVQLMRNRAWGQRFSLLYYLALTIAAVITMVSITLRGLAQWWPGELDPAVIFVPVIITSAVAAVLLIRASVAGTRLRYASVVMTTIAAVIALTVVANLIAQTDYVNVNLASYGRYGISKRTERILQSLDTPVRLTCAYNTSDENKKISSEYAPRTMELLQDMADCSENVQAVNASSDSAKARVIARLRGSIGGKADEHIKFLDTFASQSKTIAETLDSKHRRWRQVSAAYLDLWGMTARITRIFEVLADETRKTHKKIDGQIGGSGLPDYAALAEDAEKSLTDSDKTLREISAFLKQLSTISPKVRANKKSVLKKTGKCLDAALKMSAIVGKESDSEPSNPSAVLKNFITAARKTSKLASDTAKELAAIAGKENASLIQNANVWQIRLPTSNSGMMVRTTLSDLYSILAKTIDRRILDAEGLVKAAKGQYQAEVIVKMRKEIAQLAKSFSQSHDKVQSATLALCRIDPQSKKIFQQAQTDAITADLLKPIGIMLIQAQRLPKLKSSTLTADITKDNIVIIEAGDKIRVVNFDAIWPMATASAWSASAAGVEEKRIFNGDPALSSNILSMTSKPFASVLLTYFASKVDPRMQRMIPQADIDYKKLSTLTKRLTEANFKVKHWNLAHGKPKAEPDDPKTQVMIVLPPPPGPPRQMRQMPGMGQNKFGPRHVEQIRRAIDSGTPAVFLATFMPPRQMSFMAPPVQMRYGWGKYLSADWGIDVLTDYLVVPAVVDENDPDSFKVSITRFSHLQLSAFSEHPIALPLRAQRLLWTGLCPIRIKPICPEYVSVTPLLSIPAAWRDTWATRNLPKLLAQFQSGQGSRIRPDYTAGDIPAPFDVAVAATRGQAQQATSAPATKPSEVMKKAKPARIVVLGLSTALSDDYINRQVEVFDARGTLTLTDPPKANADIVVNSLYWLIDKPSYIAAGPSGTQFVIIDDRTRAILSVVFVLVLPIAVLICGGIVMMARKR